MTSDLPPGSLPWHHVHLTAEDRARSGRWYVDHLGAEDGGATKRSVNLRYASNVIQIQSRAVAKQGAASLDRIGIGCPDIDVAVAGAIGDGAKLLSESDRCVLLEDPDGIRVELVEAEEPTFSHVQISTSDPQSMQRWYANNLGGVAGGCPWDRTRLGVGYDTMWMSFTEEPVETKETRPIDHIGFFTAELDATSARLERVGAPFPIPPRPFNTVRLAFFEDPGGIWVELVELPGGKIPK